MDSRRISAAIGFALLIACIAGVVILIYNSGTSRRSPFQNPFSPSSTNRNGDHHHHHPHIISTWNENRSSSTRKKDGFVNDPNYHPEQPTMQEVNELADELHRFLSSSKSKHVHGKPSPTPVNGSMLTKPIMKNGMPLLLPVNNNSSSNNHKQSPPPSSHFQSATSSGGPKKASISVINYSSLPNGNNNNNRQQQQKNKLYRQPPSSSSSSSSTTQQQQQNEFHHSHHQPYPGHPNPPENIQHADVLPGGILSLQPNDLYTTSWLPSMIPPGSSDNSALLGHLPSSSLNTGNVRNPAHFYVMQHQQPYQKSPSNNHNNNDDDFNTNKGKVVNGSTGSDRNLYNRRNEKQDNMIQQQQHHHYHDQDPNVQYKTNYGPDKGEGEKDGESGEEEEYEYEEGDDLSGKREEERLDDLKTKGNNRDQSHHVNNDDEEEEEDDDQEDDVDPEPKNFAAELETLFELANHLYTSGVANLSSSSLSSAPVFQTFLKVINDKLQKSNESGILKELNEMYRRPSETRQESNARTLVNSTSIDSGDGTVSSSLRMAIDPSKSSYEKSLTAFIFMSFGIFLLNQIHSFVQDSGGSANGNAFTNSLNATGRSYFEPTGFEWLLDPSDNVPPTFVKKESSLDILFDPPPEEKIGNSSTNVEPVEEFNNETSRVHAPLIQVDSSTVSPFLRNTDHGDSRASSSSPYDIIFSTLSSSSHLNNMFRAMLNVANAYTRDDKALECIWSLYCQDLDSTAGERGLYGVAARINSVGLRLIMNQIPPSLTLDVILRSLVGWDGLPCRKMFPECAVGNGTISALNSTVGIQTSHNNLR